MKAGIVRIGNSRVVEIPEPLLEQSGLGEEVELEVADGAITIRAVPRRRRGREKAVRSMAVGGDEVLLDSQGERSAESMTQAELIREVEESLARPLLPPSDWKERALEKMEEARRILRESPMGRGRI